MKSSRVAFVVHTFDIGGLEHCVARLVNGAERLAIDPVLICLNRSGTAERWINSRAVTVVELDKRSGNDWRVVVRLAKALKRHRIELVHSHNWGTLLETSLARRMAKTARHIHAERGMELADLQLTSWRADMRNRVKRWAMGQADAVVAVSDSIRQKLADQRIAAGQRVRVVPNGISLECPAEREAVRAAIRRRLGVHPKGVLVGTVGRLAPVKDFGTAIASLECVVRQGIDAHLVVVGSGPEQCRLADLRDHLGLRDRCHFVGQQFNVADWLAAMDIYVNSSRNEGMSQSLLEAMACGLPMVVTDVGDNRRVVDGNPPCGLVVPSCNVGLLSGALSALAASAQKRQHLSENALARYRNEYTTEVMIDRYARLYDEVLDRDRTAAREGAAA